jgi:hypothetical protein
MPFHTIFKTLLLFIFCFYQQSLAAQSPLELHCRSMKGKISHGFQCPKSKIKLGWDFCIINQKEVTQFFDGCTTPTGSFEEIMTPACIQHDLCYHHEPATNGKTQEDCDEEFRLNLMYACYTLTDQKEVKKCLAQTVAMYLGVRAVGAIAFHCDDSPL